jgi:hypothetical protein
MFLVRGIFCCLGEEVKRFLSSLFVGNADLESVHAELVALFYQVDWEREEGLQIILVVGRMGNGYLNGRFSVGFHDDVLMK